MGTTHSSVPSWVALSKPFRTRSNRTPMLQTKPNLTQHHKDLLLLCFKTHYRSKDWWKLHPLPNQIPMLCGHLPQLKQVFTTC